eukprot:1176964-Prorocentrum_minimum.AAC.6
MLAGPKGRALGESGVKLDTGSEQGKGLRGVDWTLAVIGTGGPVKRIEVLSGRSGGLGGSANGVPDKVHDMIDQLFDVGVGDVASATLPAEEQRAGIVLQRLRQTLRDPHAVCGEVLEPVAMLPHRVAHPRLLEVHRRAGLAGDRRV